MGILWIALMVPSYYLVSEIIRSPELHIKMLGGVGVDDGSLLRDRQKSLMVYDHSPRESEILDTVHLASVSTTYGHLFWYFIERLLHCLGKPYTRLKVFPRG
jgi:hypothetical protein